MDPYLEAPDLWRDFHHRIITYLRDQLQPKLRPKYFARTEERVYVAESDRRVYPDVSILREPRETYNADGLAVMEPVIVRVDDPIHEGLVHIIDAATGELVTAIEVISPTNKLPGIGLDQYAKKREETLRSQTNLVEIDLLFEGQRLTPALYDARTHRVYRYVIGVSRFNSRHAFELYGLTLRDRLPKFRIPLKGDDPDVVLDLQAVFEQAYVNGAYDATIDYSRLPQAALTDDDQTFVKSVMRTQQA
jgi:hypothetical protein